MEFELDESINTGIDQMSFDERIRRATQEDLKLMRILRQTGRLYTLDAETILSAFDDIYRRWDVYTEEGFAEMIRINNERKQELQAQLRANNVKIFKLIIQDPFTAAAFFLNRFISRK